MARLVYLDCFSGASGDMILGACLDAGLPLDDLRRALGSLALDGYDVSADTVSRAGVAATKFRVRGTGDRQAEVAAHEHATAHEHHPSAERGGHEREAPQHRHGHEHVHAHTDDRPHEHVHSHTHEHRSLAEIAALIARSSLPAAGKDRAVALFRRLAEAEAAIHQMPVERVHLHEVGAIDSIIDIVGAVFAFEWLRADRIVASPLNVGSGRVRSAHGEFPVPAPATVSLLKGAPVYSTGTPAELVTPTGALLVTAYAAEFGPIPPMRIDRVGYGAGDRDLPGTPNVLRLLVGEADDGGGTERVLVLESEIDDMNPQIFGFLMDRLHEAGALDVFYAPVQMKKNRPGTLVTVIAPVDRRDALTGLLFRETTTLGVRYQEWTRERLDRELVTVETEHGPVRIKVARHRGAVVNAAPEFDDCARLAAERRVSLKDVQASAMKRYLDSSSS